MFTPNQIREEILELVDDINTQIDVVKATAADLNVVPEQLRDHHGAWVLAPLLVAKVQLYSTLFEMEKTLYLQSGRTS